MSKRKRESTNPLKGSVAKRARTEGEDKRRAGRKNEAILTDFTALELEAVWEANKDNVVQRFPLGAHRENCGKCWLWQGSTQNGYPALSRGHGASKLKVHMLACWIRTRQIAEAGQTTAHRCHVKLCINPEHVEIASIKENNDAKGCLCCFKLGDVMYNLCWHTPQCLASDIDNNKSFVPHVSQ